MSMYLLSYKPQIVLDYGHKLTSTKAKAKDPLIVTGKSGEDMHTVGVACFQVIGVVRIWSLVIYFPNIDELLGDVQFITARRHLDRSIVAMGWTIGLHLVCLQLCENDFSMKTSMDNASEDLFHEGNQILGFPAIDPPIIDVGCRGTCVCGNCLDTKKHQYQSELHLLLKRTGRAIQAFCLRTEHFFRRSGVATTRN